MFRGWSWMVERKIHSSTRMHSLIRGYIFRINKFMLGFIVLNQGYRLAWQLKLPDLGE